MKNNYSLFFIRHGRLILPYKNHSETPFGVLADLALRKIDPPLDKKFTNSLIKEIISTVPFKKIKRIYTSPSKRCQETADIIYSFINQRFNKRVSIKKLSSLKEVFFDLNKFYSPEEKKNININEINNRVLSAMINNINGCESFNKAYQRVDNIFRKVKNSEVILFITHDFLMRVIEVYIKKGGRGELFVAYSDLKNTHRNLYLHGLATNQSLSTFLHF